MEKLPHEFKEFLKLLNAHGVEYLLIGGYAVAYYGYPRYTGDIDVWIAVSEANAAKVVAVVRAFGFDTPDLTQDLFTDPSCMVRLGREPMKIEILTTVSGLQFEEARQHAETVALDGVDVAIISLADLRINKQASGRPKDLADLDNLPDT